MARVIPYPSEVLRSRSEIVMEIGWSSVPLWALEIGLLANGMAESVRISGSDGFSVVLAGEQSKRHQQRHAGSRHPRSVGEWRADQLLAVAMSNDAIGHLHAFLMRAYRDGMAEVSHIHIPVVVDDGELDLTFLFDVSTPPMSPQEMARRLRSTST